MITRRTALQSVLAAGALSLALTGASQAAEPTVIELTQTACQFVESENGVEHGFKTARKADCEAINKSSGADRLASSKVYELKPGKYVFRVTNRDVDYNLGFWLRGEGVLGRATLPSVSGGGLAKGVTKDYAIELKEGEYLYSCPLNPTLDYKIVVKS